MLFLLATPEYNNIQSNTTKVKVHLRNGVAEILEQHQDLMGKVENNLLEIETNFENRLEKLLFVLQDAVFIVSNKGLDADKNTISQVIVYNTTTSSYVNSNNYSIVIIDLVPILQITDEVTVGDSLVITTIEGNLIYINGEQIRFSTVDLVNNTISGLQRGSNGTGILDFIPKYSEVFGILSNNLLPSVNYNLTWNSNVYNVTDGDPLQISETNAAFFLNSGVS
jgi:hypothetical protein